MTYQEEAVKAQVKAGGSSVLIWAMGVAAVGCLALFVSCSDETTIVKSPDHHFHPPGDPKPDDWECEREHCDKDDDDHSAALYGFAIEDVFYNSHGPTTFTINDFYGGTVYVTIGINGSQTFSVDMDPSEVQKTIVDDPDWSQNMSTRKNDD